MNAYQSEDPVAFKDYETSYNTLKTVGLDGYEKVLDIINSPYNTDWKKATQKVCLSAKYGFSVSEEMISLLTLLP
jgi:hypothetical protein